MATPSLRQLDIFAQMVAAGSVMRCAGELGLSTDDVRAGIAALERRLGYRLFEEQGDRAELTAAGHKTAQAMALISQDAPPDRAHRAETPKVEGQAPPPLAPALADSGRQTIMLAAPAPVFGHFQDALSVFEAANDDIAILLDLHVQSERDAARALATAKVDIAYFYTLGASDALPSRYGWSEQLNLYAGSTHPLAKQASVAREDLADMPLLALTSGNGLRPVIDQALERGRVRMAPPSLETDDMFAVMNALREGAGCFPAFGALARDLGRMPGIKRLALDIPLPAIEVRQAIAPGAAQNPGVEALADFLFL